MITRQLIEEHIAQHQMELEQLQCKHDDMIKTFQQNITQNQARFAQLTGILAELKELIKDESNPNSSVSTSQSYPPVDRVSGVGYHPRHNLGATLLHRELDLPDPAPGKTGAGDHNPDPGGAVGTGSSDGS